MDEVQRIFLRVGLIQPIKRICLHSIYPQLPMQVRTRHAACTTHQTDHFILLHHLTDLHPNL